MSDANKATSTYLAGLRNQHAVETQAMETIASELGHMEPYPELHAQMQQELERTRTQAARLDQLLSSHNTGASTAKETVTSLLGRLSGLVQAGSDADVIESVLSAIGFKAYETASYAVLIALARAAGAGQDVPVLETSRNEKVATRDWLGEHIPALVEQALAPTKA